MEKVSKNFKIIEYSYIKHSRFLKYKVLPCLRRNSPGSYKKKKKKYANELK